MTNYYEILELKESATTNEIKASYKRLALKWHPDKNRKQDTTEKFKKLLEAYEVLINPVSRQRYDYFENTSRSQFQNSESKNYSQKNTSPVNKPATYPKPEASKKPKPFDWKTFVWKNAHDRDKLIAMEAFAQEVNTKPSKALLPDWIEFREVKINYCESPPDNNGPYIELVLREVYGIGITYKTPVKLQSLLQYRDSRGRTILGEGCDISIISLLPKDTRYSLLWPSDTLFEDSPLRHILRNCHKSWSQGEDLLKVLSLLPPKHQILICKNYFESLGLDLTKELVEKLKKSEEYLSEIRLCTAMSQIMDYKDILEKESLTSADNRAKEKKKVLAALLEKINYQEASVDNMLEALDHLDTINVLKEPRNFWDPRFPKSYSFFNEFKVAIETLALPKASSSKLVLKQTQVLKDLNSYLEWGQLKNEEKEGFMRRFETQVNNNTSPDETFLLPRALEFTRYSSVREENHISTCADTNWPFWKIIPSTYDKPPMVQISFFTAHKTGKIIHYQEHSWEEAIRDKKLTFNLNLNHLLQYRSDGGRDFFRDNFDLVLEQIPEDRRFSVLMQEDKYGKTKLMQVFSGDEKTTESMLNLLPIRDKLLAIQYIIISIEDKTKSENNKYLEKLFSYLENKAPDNFTLTLFKTMQKLIQYQSVLEQQILKSPSDLLAFEKYRLLKNVLEKIKDPQSSMETIQMHLAEVLNKNRTVLQTRRHWFNPSTPKTYSYLQELQETLNGLGDNLKNRSPSQGRG